MGRGRPGRGHPRPGRRRHARREGLSDPGPGAQPRRRGRVPGARARLGDPRRRAGGRVVGRGHPGGPGGRGPGPLPAPHRVLGAPRGGLVAGRAPARGDRRHLRWRPARPVPAPPGLAGAPAPVGRPPAPGSDVLRRLPAPDLDRERQPVRPPRGDGPPPRGATPGDPPPRGDPPGVRLTPSSGGACYGWGVDETADGPTPDPTRAPEAAGEMEAGDGQEEGPRAEAIAQPAKLLRIAGMIRELLEETRTASIDERGRVRLRQIYERSLQELTDVLSPDLQRELSALAGPLEGVPTESEIRVAQAQLVGWLEGLFHGIQAALWAQQMAARQQFEELRRRGLPSGQPPQPPVTGPPGQYL
ncbi:MAG: DUF2587 domain-containing protein [Actinobacteria bacterium]|nr:DUF2587 domain-containing protein [Actinomycetota bacterium]